MDRGAWRATVRGATQPGQAGKEGPHLARTGASQGFPRAAAPVGLAHSNFLSHKVFTWHSAFYCPELLFKFIFCFPSAAAAAKSLQSFPTLCDPMDSSPAGSSVPGIL